MIEVTNKVPIESVRSLTFLRNQAHSQDNVALSLLSPHLQYSHPRRLVRLQLRLMKGPDDVSIEFQVYEKDLVAAIENAANCER